MTAVIAHTAVWPPTPTPAAHLRETRMGVPVSKKLTWDMAKAQTFMTRTNQTFLSMFWQHITHIHPHLCSVCLWLLQSPLRLSSFQGYRKSRAVNADCLMTDARGTKRALITFLTVRRFQQTGGKTQRQWKEMGMIAFLSSCRKCYSFLSFPAEIETSLQLNEHKKKSCWWIYRKAAVFAEGTITMASGGGSSLLSTVETSGAS